MGGACSTDGTHEKCIQILYGKAEGKILIERLNRRWEDNIKIGIKETWREGVVWIRLAHDRDQW
jgi:hypothetical protein